MSQDYRTEKGGMGEVKVPLKKHLYAAQTQRAVDNFSIEAGEPPLPLQLIQAIAMVKAGAAGANAKIGQLEKEQAGAIIKAAKEIINGQHLEGTSLSMYFKPWFRHQFQYECERGLLPI